jgi:hypothetical protein
MLSFSLDLDLFLRRCYEIFHRGTMRDFDRNPRRQRYFRAWQRALALKHSVWDLPGLVYVQDGIRYRENWQRYLAAEREICGRASRGCNAHTD